MTTTQKHEPHKMTTAMRLLRNEKQEAIKQLCELLKPGETVYTILRHVSASGMSRVIDLFVMRNNEPRRITWSVAQALGYAYDRKREGLRVGGCGMDMGFHVVYSLARTLWQGNERCEIVKALRDERNIDVNAGYLLIQRWL